MRKPIRSFSFVSALMLAVTAVSAGIPARAQEPVRRPKSVVAGASVSDTAQMAGASTQSTGTTDVVDTTPTDRIIVKYRDPEANRVLDMAATNNAAADAGVDASQVAPVHVLSPIALKEITAKTRLGVSYVREMSGDAHVLQLPQSMPYNEAKQVADQIAQLPNVEYAVPSRWYVPTAAGEGEAVPNDPQYAQQWHYSAPVAGSYGANLPAAWNVTTGSLSIYVGIIDTGILFGHPDLVGRTVTGTVSGQKGYDFVSDPSAGNDGGGRDADPSDPGDACPTSSWHGTHVAGTIGAATNNSVGVSGVNWVSKIVPLRALGKCGGSTDDIVDAMRWGAGGTVPGVPANPNPARVLNLSLGANNPGACDAAEQSAINEAVSRNTVVVVAAGNSNANSNYAPGNCANVITVAATGKTGTRASYSNWGANVEIAAPGGDCPSIGSCAGFGVLSTLNAGTTTPGAMSYEWYDGTSMATPHVVGIVSLMLSVNPNLNPLQVLSIIQTTATPFPANGGKCDADASKSCGAGIINAAAAVNAAKNTVGVPLKYVYLPVVTRGIVQGGSGVVTNGDFEQGAGVGWQAYSTLTNNSDPLIYEYGDQYLSGAAPHAGSWSAWMGGYDGEAENATLRQSVSVSSAKPYLVYYQLIDSNEANCSADFARVLVNNAVLSGSATGICSSTSTYPAWQKKTLNLSAYAGQTVTLDFNFQMNASSQSIPSSWLLDDIAFSDAP